MSSLLVIYHSAHGHTETIARQVYAGASSVDRVAVGLLKAEDVALDPDLLQEYEGFILGSPTYLGGVSAPFKSFMDSTGRMWAGQKLKGRLAAGFTVSSLPAGDKQSTLLSMFIFAMQHGMVWVGNPVLPEQHSGVPYDEAANRLGSWTGLMAQAGHSAPTDAFVPGDIKGAHMFGRNFANTLLRMTRKELRDAVA